MVWLLLLKNNYSDCLAHNFAWLAKQIPMVFSWHEDYELNPTSTDATEVFPLTLVGTGSGTISMFVVHAEAALMSTKEKFINIYTGYLLDGVSVVSKSIKKAKAKSR